MTDNTIMNNDGQWPPSDAGIPLRTKFRLWTAAIIADQDRDDEAHRVEASPEAGEEPGRIYPARPPAGLDANTGYNPLP
jgi:hypothetical protein